MVVDLTEALQRTDEPEARHLIENVRSQLELDIGEGISQATAARVLRTSANTVNKWVRRGYILRVAVEGKKVEQVSRKQTVVLAAELDRLRAAGAKPGMLAAAIAQLEREDPIYQRDFRELYEPGIAAMRKGDLVPADIPAGLQPED